MNFDLPLNIDRYYLTLALRAISHTIFFHRSFMLTKPIEVNLDFLDLTYVRVDDPEIERMIDERITSFMKLLDSSTIPSSSSASSSASNSLKTGGPLSAAILKSGGQHSFILSFSERKPKKTQGWFTNEPATVPWEQWTIRLSITQSKTERDQLQAKKSIEQQLLATLLKITQLANEHKEHVPSITTQDSYPFPLQISFNNSDQSWGVGIIKTLYSSGQSIIGNK